MKYKKNQKELRGRKKDKSIKKVVRKRLRQEKYERQ